MTTVEAAIQALNNSLRYCRDAMNRLSLEDPARVQLQIRYQQLDQKRIDLAEIVQGASPLGYMTVPM